MRVLQILFGERGFTQKLASPLLWIFLVLVCFGIGCNGGSSIEVVDPSIGGGQLDVAQVKVTLDEARDALVKNQHDLVIETLNPIIRADPKNAEAYELRGLAAMRKGDFRAAILDLQSALQIAPSTDMYFNLGNALQVRGFVERASLAYLAAMEMQEKKTPGKKDPEILNNLAVSYVYAQRYEEAEALLQEVISMRPEDPEGHTNLGIMYHRQGDLGRAEAAFLQAIGHDGNYYQSHYNLAKTRRKNGDNLGAAASFRRYLELWPDAYDQAAIRNVIRQLESKSQNTPLNVTVPSRG